MASLVQTITVSVRAFGGGPSTKWGQTFGAGYSMTWGTSKWGENSINVVFNAGKLISNQVTPDSAISKSTQKVLSISVAPASDPSNETLGSGVWKYVFVNNTTNAEDRDPVTWTQSSEPTTSYVCQVAGSTIWS